MRNQKPFSVTARYYDLLYNKKDYFSEVKAIDVIIKRFGSEYVRLLDVGCGTGKHAIEFARRGYDVTGIDKSKQMIALALERGKKEHVLCHWNCKDVATYKSRVQFDVAVSLFHVFSYQTTNKSVVRFLTSIHNSLRTGGVFIFDCWFGPWVFYHVKKNINDSFMEGGIEIKRKKKCVWDINKNLVHVYHTLAVNKSKKSLHEQHTMRYFFLPEVIFFLSSCGFQLINWGSLSTKLAPMGQPQRSALFVAKKIKRPRDFDNKNP